MNVGIPMPSVRRRAAAVLLLLAVVPSVPAAAQSSARSVAITIDDLPYTGEPQRLEDAARVTDRMAAALRAKRVPATGFVTGVNVWIEGEIDERLDLLRTWRDAGVRLENHGFSHVSYGDTPFVEYADDAVRGMLPPAKIMAEVGDGVRYYRHPYNNTGGSAEKKDAFRRFLDERGLVLAPFTVEHADYLFNAVYLRALAVGDTAMQRRVGAAYLDFLDTAFAYAERVSRETFGREIPQIFLIHSNRINADHLDAMLDRLERRGYRFISLADAMEDPAYATPDTFTGPWGISWLHRWRRSLGLPNLQREESEPPAWIMEAFRATQ